jgi:hypothetical protein
MSITIRFFALKADLLLVLGELEAKRQVKYVQGGRLGGPRPAIWYSASRLPKLGWSADDHGGGRDYLIMDRASDVYIERMTIFSGDEVFDVHNGGNPGSIEFTPGGEWTDGAILAGRFATLHNTPESQALIKAVRLRIKKHFTRVRSYWVGPEALAAFRAGRRLTAAIQCPPEYDLCELPEEKIP